MSDEIAVGVPVFERTEALQRCLNSIPADAVDRVIVADNGPANAHAGIYATEWPFTLDVLDLEYDVGIGACRAAIADELTEEYLLVVDSDMRLPAASQLRQLQTALDERPSLGGVSGVLLEDGQIRAGCSNLHETTTLLGRDVLVHAIREQPAIEWVDSTIPIARFDKLTNAALVRRECLADGAWDGEFPTDEHLDFYLGHHHQTDWEFAACPVVQFAHEKGRYEAYRERVRERNDEKQQQADARYREKWGYDRIEYGCRVDWFRSSQPSLVTAGYRSLNRRLGVRWTLPLRDAVSVAGSLRRRGDA